MTLTLGIRTVGTIVAVSESDLFGSSNLDSSGSTIAGALDGAGVMGDLGCQGFGADNSVVEAAMVSDGFGSDGL